MRLRVHPIRLLPLLACLILVSCRDEQGAGARNADRETSVNLTSDRAGAGTISHVVIVWLKKPGDAESRRALIEASHSLKSIPGVLDLRVGAVLPSTRPVVDSTYDVGLVVTFQDAGAMQGYLTHPTHVRLLNEVLKPAADHYRVYDFVTQ